MNADAETGPSPIRAAVRCHAFATEAENFAAAMFAAYRIPRTALEKPTMNADAPRPAPVVIYNDAAPADKPVPSTFDRVVADAFPRRGHGSIDTRAREFAARFRKTTPQRPRSTDPVAVVTRYEDAETRTEILRINRYQNAGRPAVETLDPK